MGIVEPDQKVVDYLSAKGATNLKLVNGDTDAEYSKIFEFESSEMEPIIAKPFSPDNTCVVSEAPSVELDKSYIGSCTGAKYEDLVAAAKVLKGRKVKIRTEILPAAISIYQTCYGKWSTENFLRCWCYCWSTYLWCLLWCSYGGVGKR